MFKIHAVVAPWVKSVEFEFLFGTRKKAKQVYLAALIRLEPPLRDIMIKKYDELLDKFQLVLIIFYF